MSKSYVEVGSEAAGNALPPQSAPASSRRSDVSPRLREKLFQRNANHLKLQFGIITPNLYERPSEFVLNFSTIAYPLLYDEETWAELKQNLCKWSHGILVVSSSLELFSEGILHIECNTVRHNWHDGVILDALLKLADTYFADEV